MTRTEQKVLQELAEADFPLRAVDLGVPAASLKPLLDAKLIRNVGVFVSGRPGRPAYLYTITSAGKRMAKRIDRRVVA